jgi:outer membrane lipoprotein-sorting protein
MKSKKRMGPWFHLVAILTSSAVFIGYDAPALAQRGYVPDVSELVGRTRRAYLGTSTFRAGFRDIRYSSITHAKMSARAGVFTFSKPSSFDWEYDDGDRVISDGQALAIYQASSKRVRVRAADMSPYVTVPSFLSGTLFTTGFTFSTVIANGLAGPAYQFVALPPPVALPPATAFECQALTFSIDRTTSEVASVFVMAPNRAQFNFDIVKPNAMVSPSQFVMNLPADTTLIGPAVGFVRIAPGTKVNPH